MGSSSQASHVAMTTAASQLGRDRKSPSHHRPALPWLWIWHRQHPKPTEEHEVQFLLALRAGPRSSFLHSPPRATWLPGQGQERFLLFRCGSSHAKPFHLLWICGVLASRASPRLPPYPPVFSGGDKVGNGLPDHGPCSPKLAQIWGQQSEGCLRAGVTPIIPPLRSILRGGSCSLQPPKPSAPILERSRANSLLTAATQGWGEA